MFFRLISLVLCLSCLLLPNSTIPQTPQITSSKTKNVDDEYAKRIKKIKLVLEYGNYKQVESILKKITRLTPEEQRQFIAPLKNLLKINNHNIQKDIIYLVKTIKTGELDEYIIPFLEHQSNILFFTAIDVIGSKKISKALPSLNKILRSLDFTSGQIRGPDIIRTIGLLKSLELQSFLLEKLKDSKTHKDLRSAIIKYFSDSEIQNMDVINYLLDLVQNPNESTMLREISVYTLGHIGGKKQIQKILVQELEKIDKIEEQDTKLQYARFKRGIIGTLIRLHNPKANKLIVNMARDNNDKVRLKALSHISQTNIEPFSSLIKYMAKYDTNNTIQKKAQDILDGHANQKK